MVKISKLTILILILLIVCAVSQRLQAETSIYVFNPNQSIVSRSGGIAGIQKTFSIAGQFRLTVDSGANTASFEIVDANLTDETGSEYGQNLDEIFNMTGLTGTIIDEMTIQFEGKTADGTESYVRLKLNLSDGSAHLTGNTTPPPNTADMFLYDVNAVAIRKYAGGTGEPNNPYQIATAEDLILLGETPEDYDKHFILTADIDLDPNLPGRKVFDRAVIAPDTNDTELDFQGIQYTGTFNGNGHTISHMTIQGQDCLGLFGKLESGANVKNIGVVDVNITDSGLYAGGLAGQNSGEISVCYSTGLVGGEQYVGGLVGFNFGRVFRSHSAGTVLGKECVGGLVGINGWNSIVSGSHSAGTATGNDSVGGLVGNNGGVIGDSYSTNMVQGRGPGGIVGGLAGVNGGNVDRCVSTGIVIGGWDAGGLIGWNLPGGTLGRSGSVVDCYSKATVNGQGTAGGLVGTNGGSIDSSYSTGWVAGVDSFSVGGLVGIQDPMSGWSSACFWDTETSGLTSSDGGIGLTTSEIQTASTFLDAGWDFVDETDNGTEDIWSICEGTNYPRFVWQIPIGDFVCPDGVTIEDFAFFMEHWLDGNCDPSNGYCEGTDLDQSGTVDVLDLEILFENWPDKN